MEKHLYAQMYGQEQENWWFRGKRIVIHALIRQFVPFYRSVLDIGCGTGIVLKEFLSRGKDVYGTDASLEAVKFSQQRGLPNIFHVDFSETSFKNKQFDLILCLDVIEHVEKDRQILVNIQKNMHKGSCLLLTVPAFQILWGADDVVLGHKRRYTKGRLKELFEECGFEVVKISYFHFFIFPLVLALRWTDKLRPRRMPYSTIKKVPQIINEIAVFFYRLEAWLLTRTSFPFGASVICLARERNNG